MSRSRVILLTVVVLAAAAFLAPRSCGPENGGVRPHRDEPAPDGSHGPGLPAAADPSESEPPPAQPGEETRPSPEVPPAPTVHPDGPTLLVVDAITRAPLANPWAVEDYRTDRPAGITLRRDQGRQVSHVLPLQAWKLLGGDPAGRIRVPASGGTLELHVGAENHAWVFVEVPTSLTGEITVPLPSGGGLHLRILRLGEIREPVLTGEIEGASGRLRIPRPEENGEILFSGLAAGTWTIRVLEGRERSEVGKGRVTILPGATAELTIDAVPSPTDRAEVTGTLTVPDAWPRFPPHILFKDARGRVRGVASAGSIRDRPAKSVLTILKAFLSPGEYYAEVPPFQWRTKVTIPRSGTALDLRMPEPATVRVTVTDAATGKEPPHANVAWHTRTEGVLGYSMEEVKREGCFLPREFEFHAPPGIVIIDVEAEGYICSDANVEAVAGKIHEVEVRLTRAALLVVKFLLAREPFPAEDIKVNVEIKTKDGEPWGGGQMRRGEGDSVVFDDLESGTVEVSVDTPAGFKPVKPETIEVRQGESRELVFDLKRE